MKLRTLGLAVALMTAVAVGGCRTSSAVATGQNLDVTIEIDNNLPGLTGITAFIITETGARRSLGPVNSNQRLSFERSLRAGNYTLVASRVGGADIVSERFRLDSSPVSVFWNVNVNQLTFSR